MAFDESKKTAAFFIFSFFLSLTHFSVSSLAIFQLLWLFQLLCVYRRSSHALRILWKLRIIAFNCGTRKGLVRQKLVGSGTAFLGATGTIVQKVLAEDEVMLMDTNCILAYAESCTFDLKKTGGIVNWIGGGEGFFNSSLKGPGLVVVQSMNMCLLLESLAADKMYRR